MEDFDIASNKIGESAQRLAEYAIQDARRREHTILDNAHLFTTFARLDWDFFAQIMRDLDLNPHAVIQSVELRLGRFKRSESRELQISPAVKLIFKVAYHHATRAGHSELEANDIFAALFEDEQGIPAIVLREFGVSTESLVSRITSYVRGVELEDERLKRHFELPPFLKHFATNLNLLARKNKIPPIYGRDKEIKQIIEILCHRERSNSAMLIGEPGVGKTAIVEGLARKIEFEHESIPTRLKNCNIVSLDMKSLVAGTMLRGMFEDRIQNLLRELKERPNLIIFIDEAHTIIGAGSALGAPMDAANIFKSALARGEIRIIASTTRGEYKEYIQHDEALDRRFRIVNIPEPTIQETRKIIISRKSRIERNYGVTISDRAIDTVLELAPRYMRNLHLPDKPLSWLDTAAVKIEISGGGEVKSSHVIDVVSGLTGIPAAMVARDFKSLGDEFSNMQAKLADRVVGQKKAISAVSRRFKLNKSPLKDGLNRPDGVLMFLGPTGVGKTELAKALAEYLFGDENKMIRIDMSEYQEGLTSVNKLIGMPKGIWGAERGGILTTQLKDSPYSVVLLDEIEKASYEVLNVFLQAFGDGWITDGLGKRVYLCDCIVIMTSNIGSDEFKKMINPLGFASQEINFESVERGVIREFDNRFRPEFRNRIDEVVIFRPLTREEVRIITERYIDRVRKILTTLGKVVNLSPEALDLIVEKGYSLTYGARHLKRVVQDLVDIPISETLNKTTFNIVVRDDDVVVEAINGEKPEYLHT